MPENNAYIPQHMSPRPARAFDLRRALCAAGVSALLISVGTSMAYADALPEAPDIGWETDAPVIDGSDPDLPVEPDYPDDPAPVDPDPEVPADPVAPVDPTPAEPDPVPGNDYNPSYNPGYTPSSGADAIGAGDGAFYDPESSAQSGETTEQVAEQSAAGAPVFSNYDASTGTLSGTATAGSTVRLVDEWGNVLAEAVAGEDGWFWLSVPEGTDLPSTSIVAVDEWGNQVGGILEGASIVQIIATRERAAVQSEVEASTEQLASGIQAALNASGFASSIEQVEDAGMPVGPYVLGAASALLAVGVAGGAIALVKRSRDGSPRDDAAPRTCVAPVDGTETTSFAAVPPSPRPLDDGLDDLERLALGLQGSASSPATTGSLAFADLKAGPAAPEDDPTPPRGPGGGAPVDFDPSSTAAFVAVAAGLSGTSSHAADAPSSSGPVTTDDHLGATRPSSSTLFKAGEDPECTVACPAVQPPVDPVEFAETARVIASGSGRVHRVTVATSTVDLSGLDLFDDAHTPQTPHTVADPMVEPDWYSIALAELASDSHAPAGVRMAPSTGDYVGLVQTKRHETVAPATPAKEYVAPVIGPSGTTAADAERRRLMVEQAQTPQAVALRNRDEEFRRQREARACEVRQPVDASSCRVTKDGVPIIARGVQADPTPGPCQRSRSVGDRLATSRRRVAVPDFDQAFNEVPAATRSAVEPDPVSASVAAAYAAAVYSEAAQHAESASSRRALSGADVPALGCEADFDRSSNDELYATSPMSPAYINYMVQDEFAHRHDTPAQRNAALGRMRIVNGAATSPVSVRDGIAMHRYMA